MLQSVCVRFLPYYWLTRTCPPLLFEHKPPDSPSADPSVQLDQEWGRWPARCSHTCTNRSDTDTFTLRTGAPNSHPAHAYSEIFYSEGACRTEDSQLVDEVVSKVLRDVFMPRLPHTCSRRRGCRGHGAQVPHSIIHQAGGSNRQDRRNKTLPNTRLILTGLYLL